MEKQFFQFTTDHRNVLNALIRNNPSLMSGSFSVLIHNPSALDFDNKRSFFNQQLHKRTPGMREHHGTLPVNVRRQFVFEDSFHALIRRSPEEIKFGKLSVRFYSEEGVDAGGVTREWFQVLAKSMFNPNYALFRPCASDRLTYQPSSTSSINPEHLSFFKFVGRIIGKAVYDGRLLDAYFTRSFYKHMLGIRVDPSDLESVDPDYYKSLEWMRDNPIEGVLDNTFCIEYEEFGRVKVIDLIPNGRNIPVTDSNKLEYLKLIAEQRLTNEIKEQIGAFMQGFHDIIPADLIRIFTPAELQLLISGLPDINVDEWRANTELHNISASDPVIGYFWRAVRSFSSEEKAKLLQFVTGSSRVPLEGFGALQGVQGTTKFTIVNAHTKDVLPSAHTCFNQIDLPSYDSYESLRKALLLAINEGTEGFGFA
ncbi:HECT-domain-containing protein [Atractiella rhizophila]|nr:HECT-domain-containing protein [Atractiella rhizophila]